MAFTPAGSGQVLLFRLRLPTYLEPITEALGDDLDSSPSGTQRMGRNAVLSFPVRGIGSDLPDPYTVGQRLRRQLRSLMENEAMKAGALYLLNSIDTEQSGWYLIGGADLISGDGGFSLADYQLNFRNALKLGTRLTHRSGRRFSVLDRRLASSPLDYRCLVYNSAYAAYTGTITAALPYLVTDVRASNRLRPTSVSTGGLITIDADVSGSLTTLTPTDTLAVSFDSVEANMLTGQVVCFDRRGFTAPTFTAAGDIDPQHPTNGYGWEEVYGPVYPFTADVPVLANGLCRVRWLSAQGCFAVDWNKNTRNVAYTEMCRLIMTEETSGSPNVMNTLANAELVEYTDERATIKATLYASGSTLQSQDVYVSLQRGWTGPFVEQYPTAQSNGATLTVVPFNSGATTVTYRHNGSNTTISTNVTLVDYQSPSVGDEPWINLSPNSSGTSLVASVLETGLVITAVADTTAYGATRNGFSIKSPYTTATNPVPVPYWNGAKLDFYGSGTITTGTAQSAAGNNIFDTRSYRTVASRA